MKRQTVRKRREVQHEPGSVERRYVELRDAGYMPGCTHAQMAYEAGATARGDRLKATCKVRWAGRTKQLIPDPEGKVDPDTGKVRNKTQWVPTVTECKAPWHEGDDREPYDSGPAIAAAKKARALELGVAIVDEARQVKTQCKNGHDMEGTMPNGKPVRYQPPKGPEVCRLCKAEAAARHKAKVAAGG